MNGVVIMAKETQKEKIERLEKQLDNANSIIQKLNNEISEMIDKADNSFENSSTYKQMEKHIKDLELKLKVSNDSVEHNKKMYNTELKRNSDLIKEIQKLKNEDYTLEDIKELEQKVKNAQKNSDKWHKEYFNKDMQYKELEKKYKELEEQLKEFKNIKKQLKISNEVIKKMAKEIQELKNEKEIYKNDNNTITVIKKHNERGAGRKARFTDEQIKEIKQYRANGKTIKEIAEMFKCSVGLIHKLINEK